MRAKRRDETTRDAFKTDSLQSYCLVISLLIFLATMKLWNSFSFLQLIHNGTICEGSTIICPPSWVSLSAEFLTRNKPRSTWFRSIFSCLQVKFPFINPGCAQTRFTYTNKSCCPSRCSIEKKPHNSLPSLYCWTHSNIDFTLKTSVFDMDPLSLMHV